MPAGLIVKALSGYYYVAGEDGGPPVQCRARGIFKKRGESPLVGDRVRYSLSGNGEGAVDEILPRSGALVRPPVANADVAALVFSVTRPQLSLQLLDKFLVHAEHAGLDAVIAFTKLDLIPDGAAGEALRQEVAEACRLYGALGYPVLLTSAKSGEGIDGLRQRLAGHINLLAGQSGVGKSSLANALVPGMELATDEISDKLGRGKHTTRHVELMALPGGGYVADTPGFSQLDFAELGIDDIAACFREFAQLSPDCRFRGCTHLHEPGCAVAEARDGGRVAASRYAHYAAFMTERKDTKRRY